MDTSETNALPQETPETVGQPASALPQQQACQPPAQQPAQQFAPQQPFQQPVQYHYMPNGQQPAYIPYAYQAYNSPQAQLRRATIANMLTPRNMYIAIFAFLFSYFYGESVLSYGTHGIGVTLSTVIFCLFTFFTFYKNAPQKNARALWLYVPIGIISLGFSLHYNPMSHLPMTLTLFVLLGLQLILFTNPDLKEAFSLAILRRFFVDILGKPFSYIAVPFQTLKFLKTIKSSKIRNALVVLLGLAVAIPACALLLFWFVQADAGFAQMYDDIADYITDHLEPDIFKIFLNLFFMVVIGTFVGALLIANGSASQTGQPETAAREKKTAPALFVSTFLTVIAVIIAAFVAVQFKYFFFGTASNTVANLGYAEYARRGFFELTYASAFIFILLVLVLAFCKKRAGNKLPRYIQFLFTVICASNITILVSAVMRMALYIEVHGFSMKRLMTLWFMPILGLCTLILIARCFVVKLNALKYAGVTVIAAVCLLSIWNTDRFVAKQRVDRYLQTSDVQDLDIAYFDQLSYSCLPEVNRCIEILPGNSALRSRLQKFKNETEEHMQEWQSLDSIFAFTFDRTNLSD